MTGAEFKAWREGFGMPQEAVAELFDMQTSTIKALEKMERIPRVVEFATKQVKSVTPISEHGHA